MLSVRVGVGVEWTESLVGKMRKLKVEGSHGAIELTLKIVSL